MDLIFKFFKRKTLILLFFFSININSNVSAKILKNDYLAIFTSYNITERIKIQPIINECIQRFGKENLKIIKTNEGDVLDHKNEEEFLDCTYSKILKIIRPIAGLNSIPKKKLEEFLLNNEIKISHLVFDIVSKNLFLRKMDTLFFKRKETVSEENTELEKQMVGDGVKLVN